jgi:hypothetical protein
MTVITASPKSFQAMLNAQAVANEQLFSIRALLEEAQLAQIATLMETKKIDDDGDRQEKIESDSLKVQKDALKAQQDQLQLMKDDISDRKKREEELAKVMEGMKSFKTPLEKVKSTFSNIKEKFSGENIKKSFLQNTNILGINDKKLEKQRFVTEQKALGFKGTEKELSSNFESAYAIKKDADKNKAQIDKMVSDTGGKYSAEQIAKTNPEMAKLLDKKKGFESEYSKFDLGSKALATVSETPSQAFASQGEQQEMAAEQTKAISAQSDLLSKIEENTRGGGSEQKASAASGDSGGGLLGGIGKGLEKLGNGLARLGGGAGRGIAGFLRGLAMGLAAMANPATIVGLGAATLAIMGIGKALGYAAPFMEAFAPVLIKIADVVQNVFVAAIEKLPEVITAVGEVVMGIIGAISDAIVEVIDSVVSAVERLSEVDGGNLLKVGAGLLAIAGGLAAFGAGTAVAGVGNLVGGLLGAVTPGGSAMDQIMRLADKGENIEKAGIGIEKLAGGMTAFSAIDTDKIKAIAALPTEKIAAMGAAMGQAGLVYAKSGENAGAATKSSGGNKTNVVNAPVTNSTVQNQFIKSPIRNQDSTLSRYMQRKYA